VPSRSFPLLVRPNSTSSQAPSSSTKHSRRRSPSFAVTGCPPASVGTYLGSPRRALALAHFSAFFWRSVAPKWCYAGEPPPLLWRRRRLLATCRRPAPRRDSGREIEIRRRRADLAIVKLQPAGQLGHFFWKTPSVFQNSTRRPLLFKIFTF